MAEKSLLSCPTALGGDVRARFHTPTAPRGQLYVSPVLEIEQAFIFSINITPPLDSHRWKSQGDNGGGEGEAG